MLTIRPAEISDAEGIAQVHVATWKSTYRGLVPDRLLDNLSVEGRTGHWKSILVESNPDTNHRTLVAEIDRQVVGFVSFGKERDDDETGHGELYAIYVLKEFQGQGIGRALMEAAAHGLVELGFSSMLLWVLAENHPSRQFYERMGGIYLRDKMAEFGEFLLSEKVYVWQDLALLATKRPK